MTTGVGKGFAPSIAAANKALGGTVTKGSHPGGTAGTSYSLEKMSEFIREGRNDPRVRAWAGKVIIAAGKPKSNRAQVQALLDELRRKTFYCQDPINTELMAKPHVTLCLDDHGLCMPAADCFPQGTLLLRDDFQFVGVHDIKVGDRIWGRDRWSTVQNKWFKGNLEIDAVQMNNGSTVLLTKDHKVWTLVCDRHCNRVTTPPCPCPEEELRLIRVPVSDLEIKARLLQPKRIEFGREETDPNRAWVEGLFVSDGWVQSEKNEFCISGQDGCPKEENKRKIEALCKEWGIETRWHRKSIAVKDKSWTLRMQEMGHRAKNKHALSIDLKEAPAAAFLLGVMADSGKNTNGPGRTFTTTSYKLMLQTRVLHRMFGRSCGYSYIEDHGGLGENPIWRLNVRADAVRTQKILRVRGIERGITTLPCWDIATDDHFVYLPEHDVTVSNCDDRVIALGAAAMSVGIETRVVGASYGTPQATHVLLAIQDPAAGWLKVDPSHDSWPVGRSHPATKEWWVDPISGTITTESGSLVKQGKESEDGDFVGVGAIPFAHAFSPLAHGASYVPVGLEAGCDGTECGTECEPLANEPHMEKNAKRPMTVPAAEPRQGPNSPASFRGLGCFPDDYLPEKMR